ncbi:MAG: hypothetical protein OQK94_09380 [Gammaproteobacteria bacterium]|nr:hypothetical protein [Gammaproteobacteria bacterium]MCW8840424.1 hypothetical protein [Gammaproteobacteria bacterium]MCW8957486.1 hypothetical protein [Gammaproteobacteria bacterium]MCW8991808.1 hypothetical protein [Gammaproteobacteria bacterium]
MNKENTRKLCDDFPELYPGKENPYTGERFPFVFEHSDGWFDIVYQLSRDIMEMAHQAQVEVPEATQVKEKFGTLRFYLGPVSTPIADAVFDRANQAEEQSAHVCEGCSSASHVHAHNGWYTTLCDTCMAERLKHRF